MPKIIYRKVLHNLREAILNREFEVGSRFMSESQIVKRFSVSTNTAKKILKLLEQEKLISTPFQGKVRRVVRNDIREDRHHLNVAVFFSNQFYEYQKLFERFTYATGIQVNILKFSSHEIHEQIIPGMLENSDVDLMILADYYLPLLLKRNMVTPLTEFYQKHVFPEYSNFWPNIFSSIKREFDFYGLPYRFSPMMLIVNNQLRESLNIPLEEFQVNTFDELINLNKTLKNTADFSANQLPLAFSLAKSRWPLFFYNLGGRIHSPGHPEFSFLDRNNVRIMEKMKQLIPKRLVSMEEADMDMFNNGRALAMIGNFYNVRLLEQKDLRILPLPLNSPMNMHIETTIFRFKKNNSRKYFEKLIDLFLKFVISEDAQKHFSSVEMNLPVLKSACMLPNDARGTGNIERELARSVPVSSLFPEELDFFDPFWDVFANYLKGLVPLDILKEEFNAKIKSRKHERVTE